MFLPEYDEDCVTVWIPRPAAKRQIRTRQPMVMCGANLAITCRHEPSRLLGQAVRLQIKFLTHLFFGVLILDYISRDGS